MSFWKILRVLVTDSCNYKCIYCHNEGQESVNKKQFLRYEQFSQIFKGIEETPINQIRFSGGEPFLNPEILDMIDLVHRKGPYEIGIATNGSLINTVIAKRLAVAHVLVTLHFPGVDEENYHKVTGNEFSAFIRCVETLEENNVDYSFNFVLCKLTYDYVEDIIDYASKMHRRLKILPLLEGKYKDNQVEYWVENVGQLLFKKGATRTFDIRSGITLWRLKNDTVVKIIPLACAQKDITICRDYAELRLLPNLSFMSCITSKQEPVFSFKPADIRKQITLLWDNFNECPLLR